MRQSRKELEAEVQSLRAQMLHLKKTMNAVPDDCEMGVWCKACGFGKEYRLHESDYGYGTYLGTICTKGICQNFTPREVLNHD